MTLGADDSTWRWIAPDGQEHSGSKWDLVAQLSAGSLPPKTFVWRSGWGEWLTASKVAELASALPAGSAEPPTKPAPSRDPNKVPPRPTAAPGGAFTTVGAAPRTATTKFVRPQISPPRIVLPSEQRPPKPPEPEPPPPSSFGTIGSKLKPPPKPQRESRSPFAPERGTSAYEGARRPMPTLSEEAAPATATLRPPAAVPPPPRGNATSGPILDPAVLQKFTRGAKAEDTPLPVPVTTEPEEVDPASVDMTSDDSAPTHRKAELLPPAPAASAEKPPSELAPAIVQPSAKSPETPAEPAPPTVPSVPPPAAPPPPSAPGPVAPARAPFESTMSSEHGPASVAAALKDVQLPPRSTGSPAPTALEAPAPARDDKVRKLQLTVYALGGMAALLGILTVGLFLSKKSGDSLATEAPSASASAAPPRAPATCRVQTHPARLAATIDRSVSPLLAASDDGHAAVGFAETSKKAIGLMVSVATLDVQKVFERPTDRALKSVVPLVSSGAPTFALDVDGGALKFARTVDAKLPFSLGLGEGALSRVISSAPEPLWPVPATAITEPRVASIDDANLVTFRDGGLDGKIMVGWLAADGSKRSDLVALPGPAFVGTPFAAATKEGWVVAFAGRATAQDPWHVELALGEVGKLEARRLAFEAPPGGLGGGQLAPSVAALRSKHWLLQWTEGKSGMYQVRTQLLGPDLTPVGEPELVSPKGASSGQGAVYTTGDSAVSLYVQTIGGHDELWATTLDCH